MPCQIDGGLKCFGHPIGASGLRMLYEIYLQFHGRAEERQIDSMRYGLTPQPGRPSGGKTCAASRSSDTTTASRPRRTRLLQNLHLVATAVIRPPRPEPPRAVKYDALMGFEIPEARQTFGPLDAVRYALSIGLGRDPLDPWQLQFVDDHKGPRIVPSFCSVLGHPGFWLADPRTTVDAGRVVHAEQGFSLERPIPSAGTVVGKTRIVDIVDKGAAKGAACFILKRR